MSNHPFLNIAGIIVVVSGLYLTGQFLLKPNTQVLSSEVAAVDLATKPALPVLKSGITEQVDLGARAFLSAYVTPTGLTEVLVEKNGHGQLPIASITKLMTALVAENEIDPTASTTLANGKTFTVRTLLDSMLVESNNESASALAQIVGNEKFVAQMNQAARDLGMKETFYSNPSGLDEPGGSNFSSVDDLLILAQKILTDNPEIFAITRQASASIKTADGEEDHLAKTTDEFLTIRQPADWPAEIVGGKTGTTLLAKKNLVLILQDSATGGYLINVILGADDNFAEMTKLVNWIYSSYEF